MRAVVTAGAPKAIGPYNQGIVVGGLVYTAGQTPLDPATGEMVPGGIAEQTARAGAPRTPARTWRSSPKNRPCR